MDPVRSSLAGGIVATVVLLVVAYALYELVLGTLYDRLAAHRTLLEPVEPPETSA